MTKHESIGRMMGCLHRHSRMYFHRAFAEWDIGSGSHPFLMILWHQDGLTQKELTEMLHLDKANTARALARLMDLGYVTKKRDEEDQRAYRIYLTERGRELVPRMKKVMRRWTDVLTSGLSEEEKKETMRLLSKMADNAVEYVRGGR